jgi:long-subunit fatty acid transport protein
MDRGEDMKYIAYSAAMLAVTGTSAAAIGLDRSSQDITAIFEPGGYVELSYGFTQPALTGDDVLGNPISDVGVDYSQVALSFKMDVGQSFSIGLIIDQPYGANIAYEGDPTTTMLGGTEAVLDSRAITAIGRYRFNDNFSVHAGVRQVTLDGEVTLAGLAYAGLSGYNVELENGEGTGWLAGVAYERPDIALRVALTYNSEIENTFDTLETTPLGPVESTTTVSAPEAWNLDFQTGVAQDTLVFGNIRYAMYSQTILSPDFFATATGGASITDIEDGTSYTLGVARRFTDAFAGTLSLTYEPEGTDSLVSPLSPTNGLFGITVGGRYTMDAIEFSGGIRYTMLGDAEPETGTPDVARAEFTDNDALSVGLSVAYRF